MLLLRLAFILPALADFLVAGLTLLRSVGIEDPSIVPRVQFGGVAFAWGVLLLIGLGRPIKRAWILWPTMIAIAGVVLGVATGYAAGAVGPVRLIFTVSLGTIMIGLAWWGFRFSQSVAPRSG